MGVKFYPGCPCCGDCACDEAYLRDLFGTSGICPDATVAANPIYILAEFTLDKAGAINPGSYDISGIPDTFYVKFRSVQACNCYLGVSPYTDYCNTLLVVCQGKDYGDNPGWDNFRSTYGFGAYIYSNSGSGAYNIGFMPTHGQLPVSCLMYAPDYEGMVYTDFVIKISSVNIGLFLWPQSPVVYSDPIPLGSYTCSPKEFNLDARIANPAIGLSINCTIKLTITTDCSLIDPDSDPWWCTATGCVRSATEPGGATGGPFATKTVCQETCSSDVRYWCLYGQCVSGTTTSPHVDATGPYLTPADCAASCTGPATMVWICTEAGCGTTSKAYAVLNSITYYTSSAACLGDCASEWYCYGGTCFQWFDLVTPPLYFDSGPYSTELDCSGSCLGTGAGWYCVDFVCGYYTSVPGGASSGPHPTEASCLDVCVALGLQPIADREPKNGLFPLISSQALPIQTRPKKPTQQSKIVPNPELEKIKQRIQIPCIHLGEKIGETACGPCQKLNDLRSCAIFGKCRRKGLVNELEGEKECFSCERFEPVPKS